nr:uncharacterized protein LOC115261649 [Aedes albopictus]
MSTASGKSGKGTDNQATDTDVVTGIGSLTIVNNAKCESKDAANQVTGAQGATALLPTNTTLNPEMTNAVSSINPVRITGTKPKQAPSGVKLASVRVRITRFSHCEMCNDRDNSRMVQCDNCNLWFHFSCVDVTGGIANYSWACPACADVRGPLYETSMPPVMAAEDPPAHQLSSKRSTGKTSSKRSEQRRIDRRLQKLEELKQLEKRFLEEKYRILDEEDDDVQTIASEDSMGSNEIVKVRGWLRETEQCSEDDSGLVEEDTRLDPYAGRKGQETLHGFAPNQRSTPRSQLNHEAPSVNSTAARVQNQDNQSARIISAF